MLYYISTMLMNPFHIIPPSMKVLSVRLLSHRCRPVGPSAQTPHWKKRRKVNWKPIVFRLAQTKQRRSKVIEKDGGAGEGMFKYAAMGNVEKARWM